MTIEIASENSHATDPFYVREISLPDTTRDELERELKPYIGTIIKDRAGRRQQNAEVAGPVMDFLGQQCKEAAKDTAYGAKPYPLLIHNVSKRKPSHIKNPHDMVENIVARGLFDHMGFEGRGMILERKGGKISGEYSPSFGHIHTDAYELTALACPYNAEEAPTRVMDLHGLGKAMGDLSNHLHFKINILGKPRGSDITLKELIAQPQHPNIKLILNEEMSSPEALKRYHELLPFYSRDVILMPGGLLIINNTAGGVFHTPMPGTVDVDISETGDPVTRTLMAEFASRNR